MSKYSDEQLTAMAKSALWHKVYAPYDYSQLISILSAITGLSFIEVEEKISKLANTV